jgi:hypothetical protein
MEFKINVECTPEEARTFLGLPDLSPIHDHYIKAVLDTMSGTTSFEQMQALFKSLSPIGDASMKLFSDMMTLGLGSMTANGDKKK